VGDDPLILRRQPQVRTDRLGPVVGQGCLQGVVDGGGTDGVGREGIGGPDEDGHAVIVPHQDKLRNNFSSCSGLMGGSSPRALAAAHC